MCNLSCKVALKIIPSRITKILIIKRGNDNPQIEKLLYEKNFKVLAISIDTIGNYNRDVKKKIKTFKSIK